MSAQFAKDRVSFVTPTNLSETSPSVFAPSNGTLVGNRVRAAVKWVANLMQRRAVIDELAMLSDHELADIGLTRSEITHVFDRSFIASRSMQTVA